LAASAPILPQTKNRSIGRLGTLGVFDQLDFDVSQKARQLDYSVDCGLSRRNEMGSHAIRIRSMRGLEKNNIGNPFTMHMRRTQRLIHTGRMPPVIRICWSATSNTGISQNSVPGKPR
jgi:hypothetical protein